MSKFGYYKSKQKSPNRNEFDLSQESPNNPELKVKKMHSPDQVLPISSLPTEKSPSPVIEKKA